MSVDIDVPTESKKSVNWRYGQDYTFDNIKYTWRRTPYANKLVVGVTNAAVGKRFDIKDVKADKPIEKNDEAKDVIEALWKDIMNTIYYDRAYGRGLGVFYENTGDQKLLFRAYDKSTPTYDSIGVPTNFDVINLIAGTDAKADMKTLNGVKDLKRTYELIIRETETKGKGIGILQAVWDTIFSLASLDEQGTYYAIRYGAGIRYMKIPEEKFLDTAFMSKIMGLLKGAIGANGVYALPYATVAGVKQDFEVMSENAVQIDFISLRDLLLGSLSAQTGIPREVWLGSQTGLRSSETNEDSYFDYLQSIQDDYRLFFKWIVATLNEVYGWYPEDTIIEIEYIARDTMSDEEKIEAVGKKVDIASKAGFNVEMDWLAEQLDIPLKEKEIDPLGINQGIEGQEGPPDTDQDDDQDDDQETDNEEKPDDEQA